MRVSTKVILPKGKLFDARGLQTAVSNALTAAAKDARIDFQTTVATWQNKPTFTIQGYRNGRTIGTDDAQYTYVNEGTSVRYALMSPDFQPKTRPGFIGSSGGAGRVLRIDRAHPRPGIKARKFDEAIAEKWLDKLPEILQRAIDSLE